MFLKNKIFRFPKTLSFRLTVWYASLFVFFLLVALLISYAAIDSNMSGRMDEDLIGDIEEFQFLYSTGGMSEVIEEIERESLEGNADQDFLRLLNEDGETIFSSDLSHWQDLSIDHTIIEQLISPESNPVYETQDLEDQEASTRIIYALIGPGVVMQVGESLEEKEDVMELILVVFAGMLIVVIPLASCVGWFIARKAVQGIEEVSRAAIDIRSGEFDRRVTVKAHGEEIQTLVETFNAMAERIRNLIFGMREMIDNIAHDLRSPLARIRAIAEGTLAEGKSTFTCHGAAANTIDECDRLINLINATLDVAEAEADVAHTVKEPVDISTLVKDACELFDPLAEQKHNALICDVEASCSIYGNKQNLQRMLANLLDNALKYTPTDGRIAVTLMITENKISIVVADSGVGIAEHEQNRVFDRFYRCDHSRPKDGCGLGLSFARAVARAHGGDISLRSALNRGSIFTITLPIQFE